MSHEHSTILRPKPRRPFDLSYSPSEGVASEATTPSKEDTAAQSDSTDFSRTRSILNLTSSTLFGIYSPTTEASEGQKDDLSTPWGTRPVTPVGIRSQINGLGIGSSGNIGKDARKDGLQGGKHLPRQPYTSPLHRRIGKLTIIGIIGAAYGELVSFLHAADDTLSPGKLSPPTYLASWGLIAIAFALLLPWLDEMWAGEDDDHVVARPRSRGRFLNADTVMSGRPSSPEWIDVVRFVGACVGVSFAIVRYLFSLFTTRALIRRQRKIPWQSELQQAAAMALINPSVWYIVDRTLPGLVLSTTTALAGSSLLIATRPDLIPSPHQLGGHSRLNLTGAASVRSLSEVPADMTLLNLYDSWAVAIWTASVLFVMCVSFGNMGRRL